MSTANPPKKKRKSKKTSSRLNSATILTAIESTNGEGEKAFLLWAEYLAGRVRPERIEKLFSKSSHPLTWCVSDETLRETAAFAKFKRAGKKTKAKLKSKVGGKGPGKNRTTPQSQDGLND